MTKLSVVLITLNEEMDLPRCLESVKDIADEIVVVDSGSVDKTTEIAKKFNAKVFERKFDNYAKQKNFAIDMAKGDWIFSIDADEAIDTKLDDEIKNAINEKDYFAYTIPRRNIIFGKFIKYSRWQPELDRHIWLWRKGFGIWKGDVHEEVVVNGLVGKLKNAKIHYQYDSVRDFFEMMNRYSELEADQKLKNGGDFSYFRFMFDPIYNFVVRYFYRLGILDGWRGFILSYLMCIYHLIVWVKVWEKKRI